MAGGIAILLIVIAVVVIGFVLAWVFGLGGFAGVLHRERAAEIRETDGRPEHTSPTNPAQEHTHFVGVSDDD
jgi:hypothetical protein